MYPIQQQITVNKKLKQEYSSKTGRSFVSLPVDSEMYEAILLELSRLATVH